MGTDTIDRLIPPPWPATRRFAVAIAALLGLATVAALWWIGALGPNLAPITAYDYGVLDGTDDIVEVQLELHNRGMLPVTDLSLWEPPMVGARVEQPASPFTLPPGETTTITFLLVVEHCDRMLLPPHPMLAYSARSGAVTQHGRSLDIPGATGSTPSWPEAREPQVQSWWYALAQPVCDPEAFLGRS